MWDRISLARQNDNNRAKKQEIKISGLVGKFERTNIASKAIPKGRSRCMGGDWVIG